ncbi:hypothetical protein K7X08_006960 [Anisodus acutangulus]|uniref:Uncharacterized protein n=1 Tax=Anisodus acutangulus TaxID=402998 RepID=A0A9Q1LC99_9SOLA|nr:hypothetical protein K7X08_006960 [Anisodus acutangulus]
MARTNKRNGTKKTISQKRKALMDDVPQSEEGTSTAPEVSEMPEVDTSKEMVWKRKEEEVALRFDEPRSKELYLARLEVQRDGNLTRGGGEEGLPTIRAELYRITTCLSSLDPPEIVPARPILPPSTQLFSTQPRVSTGPRVDHSTQRDDVKKDQTMDDDDDMSERQSESESDNDEGNDLLASARSTVRATCIPSNEVDTVVAMQWSVEKLREQ